MRETQDRWRPEMPRSVQASRRSLVPPYEVCTAADQADDLSGDPQLSEKCPVSGPGRNEGHHREIRGRFWSRFDQEGSQRAIQRRLYRQAKARFLLRERELNKLGENNGREKDSLRQTGKGGDHNAEELQEDRALDKCSR